MIISLPPSRPDRVSSSVHVTSATVRAIYIMYRSLALCRQSRSMARLFRCRRIRQRMSLSMYLLFIEGCTFGHALPILFREVLY